MLERFPEPLKQIKERSQEIVQALVERAPRGMFEGLKLRAQDRELGLNRDALRYVKLPVQERGQAPDVVPTLKVSRELDRSLDGYAKAWADAFRMQEKGLPILEHQKTAMRQATLALDRAQPGASESLRAAMTYEPEVSQGMTKATGKERVQHLRSALEHEARVRTVPELQAERVVKTWQGLEAERKALRGQENQPAIEQVKERMKLLTLQIKNNAQLENILKARGKDLGLGLGLGLRLGMVLKEPDLERALSLTVKDLERGLHLER